MATEPMANDNVVKFPSPRTAHKASKYTLDVISAETVGGKVLIEGCIPSTALDPILAILDAHSD